MAVMGVTKFQRFFRLAAGLEVDRNDLKRFTDFVDHKIYDLFVVAKGTAKANARDVIQPRDVPITAGLRECVYQFQEIDEEIELTPLLDQLAARPPLGMTIAEDTEQRLPLIAGGLSVALAKSFVVIDPMIKKPGTAEWLVVFGVFHLLL
jgi:hypothetical protein